MIILKFPWIMLIPKRKNINDITDLNVERSDASYEGNSFFKSSNEEII